MNYKLHLTEKCNLNCKYCYEGEKGSKELSFFDILDFIRRFCRNKDIDSIILNKVKYKHEERELIIKCGVLCQIKNEG